MALLPCSDAPARSRRRPGCARCPSRPRRTVVATPASPPTSAGPARAPASPAGSSGPSVVRRRSARRSRSHRCRSATDRRGGGRVRAAGIRWCGPDSAPVVAVGTDLVVGSSDLVRASREAPVDRVGALLHQQRVGPGERLRAEEAAIGRHGRRMGRCDVRDPPSIGSRRLRVPAPQNRHQRRSPRDQGGDRLLGHRFPALAPVGRGRRRATVSTRFSNSTPAFGPTVRSPCAGGAIPRSV